MRCRWWAKLHVRLLASFVFIIWGTIWYTHNSMQQVLNHELPDAALHRLATQASTIGTALEATYAADGQLMSPLLAYPTLVPLHVYDAQGTLVGSNSALPAHMEQVRQALQAHPVAPSIITHAQAQHAYAVVAVQHQGRIVGAVEVYDELAPTAQFQHTAQQQLLIAGLMGLCSVVGVGLYLSGNLKRLLHEINAQSRAIVRGDFTRRITVRSQDEFGLIAADLNHMAQELEQLTAQRTEFLGKVAHELRTPLTITKGFVSMLALDGVSPKQQRTVDVIDGQLDDLSRLVNDLLELAQRQRGTLNLHPEPVDAAQLLHEAAEHHRPLLEQIEVAVEVRAANTIVHADRQRLQQVLGNLLSNAGRYARQQVRLVLDVEREHVVVHVCDDGAGIAPGDRCRIFQPFFQVAGGRKGRAGLGLTICSELVAAHGGTLDVHSSSAGGTVFTIRLPRPAATLDPVGDSAARRLREMQHA